MSVIHFDPTVYYFKKTPPHIDTDSHYYLLTSQSDLIRFRTGEQDPQRAAELRKITTQLCDTLARLEPSHGAA